MPMAVRPAPGMGMRFEAERFDAIADGAHLLFGRVRLHYYQHAGPLRSNESQSLLHRGSRLQITNA